MEAVCVAAFVGTMGAAKFMCHSGSCARKSHALFSCFAPIVWFLNLLVNALVIVVEQLNATGEFYQKICDKCETVYLPGQNYPKGSNGTGTAYREALRIVSQGNSTKTLSCDPGESHLSTKFGLLFPFTTHITHPAVMFVRIVLAGGCVFLSFVAIVSTKDAHMLGQAVFLGHVSSKTDKGNKGKVKGDYGYYWFICFFLALLLGGGVYTIAQMPFDQLDAWCLFGGLVGSSFLINGFLQKYKYSGWTALSQADKAEKAATYKGLFGDALMSLIFFMGTMNNLNKFMGLPENITYSGQKFLVGFTGMALPFILMNISATMSGMDSVRQSNLATKLGMLGVAGVFFSFLVVVFVNDDSAFFNYHKQIFIGSPDKVVNSTWPHFENKEMNFDLIKDIQSTQLGVDAAEKLYCTMWDDSVPDFPGLWFRGEEWSFCDRAKRIRDDIHGETDKRWCRDSIRLSLDSWAEVEQRRLFIFTSQLFELIGALAMIVEAFVTIKDSLTNCCCKSKNKDGTKVAPKS